MLNRKCARVQQFKPLDGAVVEIRVGYTYARRQGRRIDGETVVLRGNFHAPGRRIEDGLVRAPVAELHLVGPSAGGEGKDLVPQTNAKDRLLAKERRNGLARADDRRRIAGAVGEKDPVGI